MGHLDEMRLYERLLEEVHGDFGPEFDDLPQEAADAGEFALAARIAVEAAFLAHLPLSKSVLDDIRSTHPFRFENSLVWEEMLRWIDGIQVKDATFA